MFFSCQETSTDAGGDVVSLPAAAATSMHPLTIRDPDPMFPPQIFPLVRPAQLNSAQDPLLATMGKDGGVDLYA